MRLVICSLLLLWGSTTFAQILPDSAVLRKNHVKSVILLNSLNSSECFITKYEFNKLGYTIKYRPAMVGVYEEYEYYSDGRMKARHLKKYANHPDTSDILISTSRYSYTKNQEPQQVVSVQYAKESEMKNDTMRGAFYDEVLEGVRNDKGQLIAQEIGTLMYPCMIQFKGPNHNLFKYSQNGLIESAEIYNDKGILIVNYIYHYNYW